MRAAALAAAVALLGCGDVKLIAPTQTVVVIDAQPEVSAQAEELSVLVISLDDERTRYDERFDRGDGDLVWPRVLALQPKGGDASRRFEVVATASDADGQFVAGVRAISGYAKNKQLVLELVLQDGCIGIECDDDESCRAGGCDSAAVEPDKLKPYVKEDVPEPVGIDVDGGTATPDAGAGGAGAGGASAGEGAGASAGAGTGQDAGPEPLDCRIFADDFERPDSDGVGIAQYPEGATWHERPDDDDRLDDLVEYGVRDGALVRVANDDATDEITVASVDIGMTVGDGVRLRFTGVYNKDASPVAVNASDPVATTGLRFWPGAEFCEGVDKCSGRPGVPPGSGGEQFVEAVFSGGQVEVVYSEGDYAQRGGPELRRYVHELERTQSGTEIQVYGGGLDEIYLDRYPCE